MDNLFAACGSVISGDNVLKNIKSIASKNKYNFKNKEVTKNKNKTLYLTYYTAVTNKAETIDNNLSVFDVTKTALDNVTRVICRSRIDNKKDLLTQYIDPDESVKKSDTDTISNDSALISFLYKKLNHKLPTQLKGNFSYVIWDDELQELHAAIDAFNTGSLFYMQVDDMFYVASDAQVLASHHNVSLTVNKRAIAQWLSGRPDPNVSMFNEIKRLPNGHKLVWRNNTVEVSKFWDVNTDKRIRYANTDEYEHHFFDLLSQSVSNRLTTSANANDANNTPVFTQMSGGMDSTSVTAIANIESKKNHQTLHTLSHSYQRTQSCDEMSNINDMIAKLGLANPHFIELDKFDDIGFTELYPTDFDNPGIVLSPKYHEELALMQSLQANVLLTGNGGDEVCWGHSSSYRSRLYKGELGVINEVVKACGELNEPVASSLIKLFVKPLVPHTMQNLMRFALNKPRVSRTDNITDNVSSAWLTDEALSLLEEDAMANPFSKRFEPAKFARYHSLKTTSTYNSMRSYQKVANQYGVDVRHPFFDTDVVDFSFAIPEKMLIQGSYPKWLLRKTMEDYLPESVVWNKHKTVFDHHFANLVRSNEEELRNLLSHSGLHDLGLLDNNVLLREFDELVRNPNRHLNVDMLYAILTQTWYQAHCV
ncbi:asparagine synthase-related protein [Pseudocolwellia agarivorans]|uniref:asparagine synthase-related protein n=1 Tax=Pseudocolwellia agarivorans TaxID=1911682 RepID=UPI00098740D4|nr:asparagine synthase-related protein [Pseudocolwellia agarivorans]